MTYRKSEMHSHKIPQKHTTLPISSKNLPPEESAWKKQTVFEVFYINIYILFAF